MPHRLTRLTVGALSILALSACAAPFEKTEPPKPAKPAPSAFATDGSACEIPKGTPLFRDQLIRHINAAREKAGVAPLQTDPRLQEAAQQQACDDGVKGIYSHIGLDGSTLRIRLKRAGFPEDGGLENTGMGNKPPEQIVGFWMTSPFHRRNMLSPHVNSIGVGLAHGHNGNNFWIADFGKAP